MTGEPTKAVLECQREAALEQRALWVGRDRGFSRAAQLAQTRLKEIDTDLAMIDAQLKELEG